MAKRNISFTKPPEPAFLKRIKEKIGYQEGPTVDTKKQPLPLADDDDDFSDEEKPIVVVLNPDDLKEESILNNADKDDEGKSDGKIVFRKPDKRVSEESNPFVASSKRPKTEAVERIRARKAKAKQVKNSSLLSFDEDDD